MPGMKCKQYKKINEYFDPDIDFGIKQYVADYQAVYLTFDIETSLMWQSGKMAIAQYGVSVTVNSLVYFSPISINSY